MNGLAFYRCRAGVPRRISEAEARAAFAAYLADCDDPVSWPEFCRGLLDAHGGLAAPDGDYFACRDAANDS